LTNRQRRQLNEVEVASELQHRVLADREVRAE
jgi:hypothetical protein